MFAPLATRLLQSALIASALAMSSGCIYKISVQQGNLLQQSVVEQVEVGMSRSQVQFLLGTPMVDDPFHEDRWDYMYYLLDGRSHDVTSRWVIVYFEGERVVRIETEAELNPTS
jgi:outer membrane protein assembly factor BamE